MIYDGVDFIRSAEKAATMERNWARFTQWVQNHPGQYPDGYHHQGMHWSDIYSVLSANNYKTGVLRVAHFKLGPKHIKCLRKERLPGGIVRWVLSYHWEGHCPGCQPLALAKRPKLLLRANRTETESQSTENEDSGRPKLLLRRK